MLHLYGWDSSWTTPENTYPARVVTVHRSQVRIVTDNGPQTLALSTPACTGDWLAVGADNYEVLPRRTTLARAVASGQSEYQVLAANVDTVVVAFGLDRPLRLNAIERFLTLAWSSGATPVVALTKADTVDTIDITQVSAIAPGAAVVAVSSYDSTGIVDLIAALTGTIAVIGPSGAGKSTLINALSGAAFATGSVRDSDRKGRHTTVTRDLIPLAELGLVLIDTPGLRGAGVWDAEDGLSKTFDDIASLAGKCRFSDCAHRSEPGCAVRGTVDDRRIESYQKLQREDEWMASRSDARLRAEHERRFKSITKSLRQHYGNRGYR